MVKVYGIIKKDGFSIGDHDAKVLIGTYTKEAACKIIMDDSFIARWNNHHFASIYKITIEIYG